MKLIAIIAVVVVTLVKADNPSFPFKVYGQMYAMNNNFNDGGNKIKSTFGDGPKPQMDVTFDFDSQSTYGYPAICRGWHFNLNPVPSDTLFPKQVSTIKKLPVTLDYTSSGTNQAGDFALDLFFRKDTTHDKPELEVMVWGDHNSIPIGSKVATEVVKDGGRTFDLWEGNNDGAGYYVYSFVPTGSVGNSVGERPLAPKGSLNVDVKNFLDYLQQNKAKDGKFSDQLYLHVVEAGFEVANGHGKVTMTGTIDAM